MGKTTPNLSLNTENSIIGRCTGKRAPLPGMRLITPLQRRATLFSKWSNSSTLAMQELRIPLQREKFKQFRYIST
ncbi:MAG: hypothetical protein QW660_04760 [Candidatus Bathyarchaeia archaeon]